MTKLQKLKLLAFNFDVMFVLFAASFGFLVLFKSC